MLPYSAVSVHLLEARSYVYILLQPSSAPTGSPERNLWFADMHGCMIQGLQVQPGDCVLDVGSGCGVTTAMMAFLVRAQTCKCVAFHDLSCCFFGHTEALRAGW